MILHFDKEEEMRQEFSGAGEEEDASCIVIIPSKVWENLNLASSPGSAVMLHQVRPLHETGVGAF